MTIVTYDRQNIFGRVVNGEMVLNNAGKIAQKCWLEIPEHFPNVDLDEFIVMPNHVHGIIEIKNVGIQIVGTKFVGGKFFVGAKNISPLRPPQPNNKPQFIHENQFRSPSKTIGSIVRGFKIGVTKWFRQNTDINVVWQRNYWEHIIRNETELNRIRNYIINNPKNWGEDRHFRK